MADRIIKGDSGNDVIIQNNAGSRKIEVTNSGDVEVTGDFKATTVKATNLKANDGTASLEIADSTGDVGFSGNTNLKIKLPSGGGIYESDGSTEILTESSGVVTLKNVIAGSGLSGFASTNGITMADQWRLNTTIGTANGPITSNLERVNDGWFTQIGTGMTFDTSGTGIFSFPEPGVYLVTVSAHFISNGGGGHAYGGVHIQITENNADYSNQAEKYCSVSATSSYGGTHCVAQIDVDSITNIKVKFNRAAASTDFKTIGDANANQTTFTFVRLGDT